MRHSPLVADEKSRTPPFGLDKVPMTAYIKGCVFDFSLIHASFLGVLLSIECSTAFELVRGSPQPQARNFLGEKWRYSMSNIPNLPSKVPGHKSGGGRGNAPPSKK